MREFTTAVQQVTDAQNWIEFTIDGYKCRAVREPADGQVAFIMTKSAPYVPEQEKLAAMLNFFDSCLDDDSQAHISGRLLNPRDPFGVKEISQIIAGLMEEWSGRPTQ